MAYFEVGKKVVALNDHRQGIFRKGDVFTVRGMCKGVCKCNKLSLDIGITKDYHGYMQCSDCGEKKANALSTIAYFHADFFAPIDEQELSNTTYEDIIAQIERTELHPA